MTLNEKESLELELYKRKLGARKFDAYIDYAFEGYIWSKWNRVLAKALQAVEDGRLSFLMLEVPPRWGKTEMVAKRFPAFCLGKNPKRKVLVTSYAATLAEQSSRHCRKEVTGQRFQNIFPKINLSDEKRQAANWETEEGGGYYAAGVSGSITGMGFDIGIIDDYVKNREDAESPVMREKLWEWYTSTFLTRDEASIQKSTAIIVFATRWHVDDLAGKILQKAEKDDKPIIKVNIEEAEEEAEEAIERACGSSNGILVIKIPALNSEEESNYPERFSTPQLIEKRQDTGAQDWSALYMQDPILSMGGDFTKDQFRYVSLSDLDAIKNEFEVGIVCDPAFSTKSSADSLVVIAQARHRKTGEIYELDKLSGRFPPSVGCTLPVNMAMKWKAAGWNMAFLAVEDVSLNKSQQLFVQSVDDEMRRQKCFITLQRYKPSGKKEDRIRYKLEPYFSRGAYYFRCDDPANDAWRKAEEEFLRFPTGDHDDHPDAAAMGVEIWESFQHTSNSAIVDKQQEIIDELEQDYY